MALAISTVNRSGYAVARDDPRHMDTLGKRVRGLRKTHGLTQTQLAQKVGVSQSAISDIESGDTKVTLGPTMAALCAALRTNPDWLQSGHGSPGPAVTTGIDEGELLAIFRVLPEEMRTALMMTARSMQAATAPAPSGVNPFAGRSRSQPAPT